MTSSLLFNLSLVSESDIRNRVIDSNVLIKVIYVWKNLSERRKG